MAHALEGLRIKAVNSPHVYLMLDGVARHIRDPEVYKRLFADFTEHELVDFERLTIGPEIPHGARFIRAKDGPTRFDIYLLLGDERRHIGDPEVTRSWGFSNNVDAVEYDIIAAIRVGAPITYHVPPH